MKKHRPSVGLRGSHVIEEGYVLEMRSPMGQSSLLARSIHDPSFLVARVIKLVI